MNMSNTPISSNLSFNLWYQTASKTLSLVPRQMTNIISADTAGLVQVDIWFFMQACKDTMKWQWICQLWLFLWLNDCLIDFRNHVDFKQDKFTFLMPYFNLIWSCPVQAGTFSWSLSPISWPFFVWLFADFRSSFASTCFGDMWKKPSSLEFSFLVSYMLEWHLTESCDREFWSILKFEKPNKLLLDSRSLTKVLQSFSIMHGCSCRVCCTVKLNRSTVLFAKSWHL